MQIRFNYRAGFLILVLAFGLTPAIGFGMETIVLGTTAISPITEDDQSGFLDRLVGKALDQLGYKLRVEHLPAERSLLNANNGLNDGDLVRVGGLGKIYTNLIQVAESPIDTEMNAFTTKNGVKIENWNDLIPYAVGIIIGWKILEQNIPSETVTIPVNNVQQLFSLLINNRADFVIYSKWLGLKYIKTNRLLNINIIEPALTTQKMYIYLNKRHAELAKNLAKKIREMKDDGTYQNMYQETLSPLLQ